MVTERPAGAHPSLRVTIRVKPLARTDRVGGLWNETSLLVQVQAPAVDGRANEAVCRSLADAFGLTRHQVAVVSGHRSRTKVVELAGDPLALGSRLAELIASPGVS